MCAQIADVENEYVKNERLKREDVDILKQWMNKQPHLPKISDLQIIIFLHSCYYNIERAKICIEKYYTIRCHVPELFANRNPQKMRRQLELGLVTALPFTEPDGVLYMKMLHPTVEPGDYAGALKVMDMTNALHYYEYGTFKKQSAILDAHGLTLSHLMMVNLMLTKKAMVYLQEAVPIRLKHVHIINTTPLASRVFTMFKPFIKSELLKMIHFHDTLDTLFEYVPQRCLPNEYGGEAGTIEELCKKQYAHMQANWKYFEEDERLVCNESKRLNKSEYSPDQLFGIDGTFKKLEID